MPREVLVSNEIAPTAGPFSAAVRAGEFIFLSGQVAQHPQTGKLIAGDVTAQAEQVFANIRAVLRAAGKTPANVVRVCVYLTDMNDFHKMNTVYARQFDAPYPARTTIAVSALPMGAAVEMDLVAR
jgi:2-iminobutanoate/2-iminopropanoate deaminase